MRTLTTTLIALAFLALLPGTAQAQSRTQEQLKQRYDAKLAKAFVTSAPWITDYDKAREEAKKSGKLIFVYFTRSYAR